MYNFNMHWCAWKMSNRISQLIVGKYSCTTVTEKFIKNKINVVLCFSKVSIASHSSSSTSAAKMNLHRILSWMWCFLITSECYNAKNRGEDGSKLIRIDGDIILGGIFPMHEQVTVSFILLCKIRRINDCVSYTDFSVIS